MYSLDDIRRFDKMLKRYRQLSGMGEEGWVPVWKSDPGTLPAPGEMEIEKYEDLTEEEIPYGDTSYSRVMKGTIDIDSLTDEEIGKWKHYVQEIFGLYEFSVRFVPHAGSIIVEVPEVELEYQTGNPGGESVGIDD